MTVLALHALYAADTVIYDALVSEEILALANGERGAIYAGKRGGKPSPKQHDISHKLIGLAREGRRVFTAQERRSVHLRSGRRRSLGAGGGRCGLPRHPWCFRQSPAVSPMPEFRLPIETQTQPSPS